MEVTLVVDNVNTQLTGLYPRTRVDGALSFFRDGYFFDPRYRMHRWDGKVHLLSRDRFPTGLLGRVQQVLSAEGYTHVIEDHRKFPTDFKSPQLPGITLRPYQIRTVLSMLGKLRGIVQVPTAGGKTYIAASAIKALNLPTVYIVHTSTLMQQTYEVFSKMFGSGSIGLVGGGKQEWRKVTVCMVQTLMSLMRQKKTSCFKGYEALVVDECHHLASDGRKASWYLAAEQFVNASVRFGLSATPVTEKHGMLLVGATGPILSEVTVRELQAKNYISESKIRFYETPTVLVEGETWLEVYREGIVYNPIRNEIGCRATIMYSRKSRLVMVFVELIEHGKILLDTLSNLAPELGVAFLSGQQDRDYVQENVRKAKNGEVKVLVVTRKLFGEGVDIPAIDVLINMAAGESVIVFTQMFGRGLRIDEGKEWLTYIDFVDRSHKYLAEHSRARIAHCKRLHQEVEIVSEGLFDGALFKEDGEGSSG